MNNPPQWMRDRLNVITAPGEPGGTTEKTSAPEVFSTTPGLTVEEGAALLKALTPPPADPAEALLAEAAKIVTGARRNAYGNPEDNFKTIADLWTTYLHRRGADFTDPEQKVAATDVAAMMILMKTARLAETPDHHDSLVDIAGYAACHARCVAPGGGK